MRWRKRLGKGGREETRSREMGRDRESKISERIKKKLNDYTHSPSKKHELFYYYRRFNSLHT